MPYSVTRALETDRDLELIFDFLSAAMWISANLARTPSGARPRGCGASSRRRSLWAARRTQGTLRPDLLPGLRSVTRDRAIFYFDVDDDQRLVRVLAVFSGGQDHARTMLSRLLGKG